MPLIVLPALLTLDVSTSPPNVWQDRLRLMEWCGAQITDAMLCERFASELTLAVVYERADRDCAFDVMQAAVAAGDERPLDFGRCLAAQAAAGEVVDRHVAGDALPEEPGAARRVRARRVRG